MTNTHTKTKGKEIESPSERCEVCQKWYSISFDECPECEGNPQMIKRIKPTSKVKEEDWVKEFEDLMDYWYLGDEPEGRQQLKDFISSVRQEGVVEAMAEMKKFILEHRTADDGDIIFAKFSFKDLEFLEIRDKYRELIKDLND